jgi:hypothetical protein
MRRAYERTTNVTCRNFRHFHRLCGAALDTGSPCRPRLRRKPRSGQGFHTYKVGAIDVTALYDGIWEKPHDPAAIKNASVEDTKSALARRAFPPISSPFP